MLATSEGARQYTFGEAVIAGWADDGGMLWPTSVPVLDSATLSAWAALDYPQLCAALLKLFLPADDELSPADVDTIVHDAFRAFGSADVVNLVQVPVAEMHHGVHIAELWHGPTLAFKDLGMAVLGRTLSLLLRKRRERVTLLVGTSGDTGSSAIEAVRGQANIHIVVLYPLQSFSSISPVQERQMTAACRLWSNARPERTGALAIHSSSMSLCAGGGGGAQCDCGRRGGQQR